MRLSEKSKCPVCNAKNTLKLKRKTEEFEIKDFPPLKIRSLEFLECSNCEESFYTSKSDARINAEVAFHKAKVLSSKVTVDQIVTQSYLAKMVKLSRQRISAMIHKGQIEFVCSQDGEKFPLKTEISRLKKRKKELALV
ncbi:MAG: hypothetical protein AAF518_01450 [Spirochaetota bacterium]